MLVGKLLILNRARAVGSRIPPAVKEVPTLTGAAAAVAGCLGRCRAVIDDPNLAKRMDARINVRPVRIDFLQLLSG